MANRHRQSESGYILLTLMLMVTLLFIAAIAIVPEIKFEIRRDREEELIHRGVQYSRAIRAYYKKFGRYPTRLEDLESSNNLRFLRKRYKDPVTGQDFKLLHYGEVKMGLGGMMGGSNIPGANPVGGPANGGLNGPGGLSQSSGFGGGASSGFGANSNSFGSSSGSSFGSSSGSSFGSSPGTPGQSPQSQPGGTDPSQSSSSSSSPFSSGQNPGQGPGGQTGPGGAIGSGQLAGATFGGGPIVGVVSASKKDGIREFNHKKKYEEWQFIYDPASDRGGLLNTPNQPPLQGLTQQMQPGQTQQPGGFPGTTSGPIPGMMNNPNPGMEPNGPGTPTPPSSPPQQ
jgi:type II secretory pathway pseudopilin PulG